MPDYRPIRFEIDPATWGNVPPPGALVAAARQGSIDIDLDAALLFAGIWTRPPALHGFTLADCWAWLRYYPAFLPGGVTRLRREWTHIDPHQKTVASDDFGVGFGTWVLQHLLNFRRYADTLYVVNVLERGQWLLRRQAKRGPAKSPDYIAYDATGAISVVECKGTQTSQAELRRALARGTPQKRSLTALGAQRLIHQLVVGVYIPQYEQTEQPLIAVHDPEKPDSRQELRKYSEGEIRRSTEQVSFAKELAVFELSATAASLSYVREAPERLDTALRIDIDQSRAAGRTVIDNTIRVQRDIRWATPLPRALRAYRGVRFSGELPLDALEAVTRYQRYRDLPDQVLENIAERDWRSVHTDSGVRLYSPAGATYEIEWLE
ncbi:hypothetical protein [Longimicrobium sp.]|uniref:hypothetical protein n=1 Tax=Longimicrobium sp. TaxID=2029185 RepID=UPI002BF9F975|nr:hypothetical protein [Longimicrobium sp.]HSU15711.1 hypothetical protein [Longimicrobium sp.]